MTAKELSRSLDYFKRIGSPVVAQATASGGPVCILRVSGKNLDSLKDLLGGSFPEERVASYRNVGMLDKALVLFFRGPRSFTGEDVLEIQCHGVDTLVDSLIQKICSCGVRLALPGEFSFRAYFNKKMTLEQAQFLNEALSSQRITADAISKLIGHSKLNEEKANEAFVALLDKVYSARGRVESSIDFPEAEEEQSADVASALSTLEALRLELNRMLSLYENFVASASFPTVCIVGSPNAGKSTLFNLLCGAERSLVSDTKGTTRDYLESIVRVGSNRIRLIDTAGLRVIPDGSGDSSLEKLGMERGLDIVKDAQLLLWVKPFGEKDELQLEEWIKDEEISILEVFSFGDRVESLEALDLREESSARKILFLLEKTLKELSPKIESDRALLLSSRQFQLLRRANSHLDESLESLIGARPIELCAQSLQEIEKLLKQCIGQDVGEEYIGEIFGQFCLGK